MSSTLSSTNDNVNKMCLRLRVKYNIVSEQTYNIILMGENRVS